MYKNVKNELPVNTFECIVKMWNQFNDSYETGIGIYDVPTEQWEIQDNGVVVNYPVHFWFKTPELDESTINGVVSSYLIKFNEVDAEGNMYLPNSINIESLNNLKVSGQIKDFEIDENGVKVIKDFRLESGSL